MSLDATALVKLVKQAALEAMNANAPTRICFGTVLSPSPLEISVDQKLTLKSGQLMLTNNVRDYEVEMEGPQHGKIKYKVYLKLKAGEKVILLRCDGGQKYVVLDRWEAP